MRLFFLILLLPLFSISAQIKQGVYSGQVFNKDTGEPLSSCNVYVAKIGVGTVTNINGFFTLPLPQGKHQIKFSNIGYQPLLLEITIDENTGRSKKHIELEPRPILEREIKVSGGVGSPETIMQIIEAKQIAKIPTLYSDVLRSVQILSGVASGSELSSGYNVRGGTHDENLIYLNGYEIYRPFLLRQGIEENQSLINPMLVGDMKFYNGSFSAKYGDKMSSALEVNYPNETDKIFTASIRADLLNLGSALQGKYKNLKWSFGLRKAYPSLFLDRLQTLGDYKPNFFDLQFLANYSFTQSSSLELFLINAVNQFNLSPREWSGNFRSDRSLDFASRISIPQNGFRNYSYSTGLYALKYKHGIDADNYFSVSYSKYIIKENESASVNGSVYYSPSASNPEMEKEFLFDRYEYANNQVNVYSDEVAVEYKGFWGSHSFVGGVNYKSVLMESAADEIYSEAGPRAILIKPKTLLLNRNLKLNSFNIFVEDNISVFENLKVNLGARFLYYSFTKEVLLSPRFNLVYNASSVNTLTASFGYYYQPPFYAELSSPNVDPQKAKSQRAIHYVLGWEHKFSDKMILQTEFYYKDLSNLFPFYYDDIKPKFTAINQNVGFAYGFDVMLHGEIVEGVDSRIGYGYLNTKEKMENSNMHYKRRLMDQTHTIQIFFQDRMKKSKNWQAHLRFLVGSGFLFNTRKVVVNSNTGVTSLEIDMDKPEDYFLFLNVDMGLSASFNLGNNSKLTIVGEVLNIFDHYNVGGYDWIQVFKDLQGAVRIPKVLSKRFFNLRLEFSL